MTIVLRIAFRLPRPTAIPRKMSVTSTIFVTLYCLFYMYPAVLRGIIGQ